MDKKDVLEEIINRLEQIDKLLIELKHFAIEEKIPFLERNIQKAQAPIQVALSSCGKPICEYEQ